MNKTIHLLAAASVVALGFAGAVAQAQEATYDYPQPAVSSVTRAQVQADLAQAKREGTMRVWSTSYNHMAAAKSVKSRAEVQAELLGTDRAEVNAMNGEDSGSFALARKPAVRSVGTVLATR